jgi:hypothetical protein
MPIRPTHEKTAIEVNGYRLMWSIRHTPTWRPEGPGYDGLVLFVESAGGAKRRGLVIEYPFQKRERRPKQERERVIVREEEVAKHVEQAMSEGWDPESRGKPAFFVVEE